MYRDGGASITMATGQSIKTSKSGVAYGGAAQRDAADLSKEVSSSLVGRHGWRDWRVLRKQRVLHFHFARLKDTDGIH